MRDLGHEQVWELLLPYGAQLNDHACGMIEAYISVLARWNAKTALTAVTGSEEMVRFHFGESLFAVSALGMEKGRLADIGTGAGFPGVPIRIALDDLDLTLIEANAKKAAFLAEAVRMAGLKNVKIIRSRMEDVEESETGFDFITARAVGDYKSLLEWSQGRLAPGGRLVLWLGAEGCATISQVPGWRWDKPIKIPHTQSRFLLQGHSVPRETVEP